MSAWEDTWKFFGLKEDIPQFTTAPQGVKMLLGYEDQASADYIWGWYAFLATKNENWDLKKAAYRKSMGKAGYDDAENYYDYPF